MVYAGLGGENTGVSGSMVCRILWRRHGDWDETMHVNGNLAAVGSAFHTLGLWRELEGV